MKKIFLGCFFVVFAGFVVADANAQCKLEACAEHGGSKGKGYTLLRTDGERSHDVFTTGQCYRCNWGPNASECSEGTVVAIGEPDFRSTRRVKGFYKCIDSRGYNDDWVLSNPTETCDDTISNQFSRLLGGRSANNWVRYRDNNAKGIYTLGGAQTEGDIVGDSVVMANGTIGCVVYICKEGFHTDSSHDKCIKGEAENDGGQEGSLEDCQEGEEKAKKDINLKTACAGKACSIKKGQCYSSDMLRCLEAVDRGEPANWNGKSCDCGSRDGVNYSWDSKQKKCVAEKTPKKTCKELYNNYPERIKCCEAGNATYWEPKNDLINGKCYCYDKTTAWDSKTGKCVKQTNVSCEDAYKGNTEAIACCEAGENWIDGKCECNEENKVWDSKLKKCVANATPVTTCTPSKCYLSINQNVKCSYNDNYWKSNEKINICEEQLSSFNTCSDLQSRVSSCQDVNCISNIIGRINAYDELIERVCEESIPVSIRPDNSAEISAAKSAISAFFSTAESSANVWKDKDGNFNTARLASDLTAGVVLGTVGGAVSGVVIKKKQVEKGFDALHCTVGGQTVADWGDIFNVGLRR